MMSQSLKSDYSHWRFPSFGSVVGPLWHEPEFPFDLDGITLLHFAIDRSEPYLMWRYGKHPDRHYRLLVLRRQAGVGIDAFIVVRMLPLDKNRFCAQLVDHCPGLGNVGIGALDREPVSAQQDRAAEPVAESVEDAVAYGRELGCDVV